MSVAHRGLKSGGVGCAPLLFAAWLGGGGCTADLGTGQPLWNITVSGGVGCETGLRRASHLYGWHNDGAQATRDRPGREFLRGPGTRRNTPARIEPIHAERSANGSNETSRSDPGPSEGVQTAHGPAPRLAEGAMQRQPVQARVGYPAALPSPRLPRPEVHQRV